MPFPEKLHKFPVQDYDKKLRSFADPYTQRYQAYLDKSTPYTTYRWISTGALLLIFLLRIVIAQGWYIGTSALSRRSLYYQDTT